MSENPYAPPASALTEPLPDTQPGNPFFVTSTGKLVLMNLGTLGVYEVFWFYMHWARYRRRGRRDISPVMRAVFALFFVHQLAREIDGELHRTGVRHVWWPGATATAYVVISIASYVCNYVPVGASRFIDLVPLLLLGPTTWTLHSMQRAANLACGQPNGESNRSLSWANWVWLAIGSVLWLLVLAGYFLPEG